MKTTNVDIIDFYRQLSLLLESNLPLPESLKQMAENFQKKDFKDILSILSTDTASGTPLSDAMRKFPGYFQAFHLRMVEGGEKTGNLPEILREIAYMSQVDLQLVSMTRSIAAYPIFILLFSALIMFAMSTLIIPLFDEMITDLWGDMALPPLTGMVFSVSRLFSANAHLLSVLLSAAIIFFLWLFLSGSALAARCFIVIIRNLPLSGSVFNNLAMARITSVWSVLMSQKMPADQALQVIAGFIDDSALSSALRRISKEISGGISISDSLENEALISRMIPLVLKNSPESELPGELANLADVFRERASSAIRNTRIAWEAILTIIMAVQVGAIVISLFMPLVSIVDRLGG